MSPLTPASTPNAVPAASPDSVPFDKLLSKLTGGTERSQRQAIADLLEAGEAGWLALCDTLCSTPAKGDGLKASANLSGLSDGLAGSVYRALLRLNHASITPRLETHFPDGIVPLHSQVGLDYSSLQELLLQEDYETADRQTLMKLCELAGPTALKRGWLYFSEVDQLPIPDLQTLDRLWFVYSEGKFGFSVQRDLWLAVDRNWEDLWVRIGWKTGNTWTRYPGAFTWSLGAPRGHLPLTNQLRGVRVMNALMNHPAFAKEF